MHKILNRRGFSRCAFAMFLLAGNALAVQAQTGDKTAIPDFAAGQTGWHAQGVNFKLPPGGPHNVTEDPAYPFTPTGRGEAPQFRVADLTNPILQSWTRNELKKRNDSIIAGGTGFTRQASCWPMGVPAFDLIPGLPVVFIQTPKEIVLIAQMNYETRHIYLNVPHSARVKPSWYGESVGHYEGDTLVVDTIGLNDKTWVDNFRTPHSDKLRVIERFHMINGGKILEVNVHVEDPGAFTLPWDAVQRYDREPADIVEPVCAENTFSLGNPEPLPQADRPDF